jgi:uncharacterized protein Yka (UPF0111/DUF47 family)
MEQKKKLLIKVLKKLKPHWHMAEGFLALVESSYITDNIIDKLIGALQESIQTVTKETEKDRFKKGLDLVQKIKIQEEKEDKITDKDLDKLLENM